MFYILMWVVITLVCAYIKVHCTVHLIWYNKYFLVRKKRLN